VIDTGYEEGVEVKISFPFGEDARDLEITGNSAWMLTVDKISGRIDSREGANVTLY